MNSALRKDPLSPCSAECLPPLGWFGNIRIPKEVVASLRFFEADLRVGIRRHIVAVMYGAMRCGIWWVSMVLVGVYGFSKHPANGRPAQRHFFGQTRALRSREGRCRPPLFEGGTDDKPPRHDPKSIATR